VLLDRTPFMSVIESVVMPKEELRGAFSASPYYMESNLHLAMDTQQSISTPESHCALNIHQSLGSRFTQIFSWQQNE
jgi:hypothetical protein